MIGQKAIVLRLIVRCFVVLRVVRHSSIVLKIDGLVWWCAGERFWYNAKSPRWSRGARGGRGFRWCEQSFLSVVGLLFIFLSRDKKTNQKKRVRRGDTPLVDPPEIVRFLSVWAESSQGGGFACYSIVWRKNGMDGGIYRVEGSFRLVDPPLAVAITCGIKIGRTVLPTV